MKLIAGINNLKVHPNGEITDVRYMTHDYVWYYGKIRLPDSNDGYLTEEEKENVIKDLTKRECAWYNIFYCEGNVCGVIMDQWEEDNHVLDMGYLEQSWSEEGLMYVFKETGFHINGDEVKLIICK